MTKARLHTLLLLLAVVAIAAFAGCRSAHTTSAILYIDEQDYQKAVDVIDEGLSYDPDDAEAYYWQGEAYSHMAEKAVIENDYKKAKESYELAYQKYSKAREMDPEALTDQVNESLGISYNNRLRDGERMWQGNYFEQAEGYFRLAYAAWPDSATPLRDIANLKMSMAASASEDSAKALMTEALTFLDAFIQKDPSAYQARADKAYVLTYLGRLEDAQVLYDDLLKTDGDKPELLKDVVVFAQQRQNYRWAADLNVKIADIYAADDKVDNDDKIAGLLTEAAKWYASRDVEAYTEALAALKRASELDPGNAELQFSQLQTCFFAGQDYEEKAETAAEPQKQQLLDQAHQMFQQGVEAGNALIAMAPTHTEGYKFLAYCQYKLGDSVNGDANMKKHQELLGGS